MFCKARPGRTLAIVSEPNFANLKAWLSELSSGRNRGGSEDIAEMNLQRI
jgi:hypothetical protein